MRRHRYASKGSSPQSHRSTAETLIDCWFGEVARRKCPCSGSASVVAQSFVPLTFFRRPLDSIFCGSSCTRVSSCEHVLPTAEAALKDTSLIQQVPSRFVVWGLLACYLLGWAIVKFQRPERLFWNIVSNLISCSAETARNARLNVQQRGLGQLRLSKGSGLALKPWHLGLIRVL